MDEGGELHTLSMSQKFASDKRTRSWVQKDVENISRQQRGRLFRLEE